MDGRKARWLVGGGLTLTLVAAAAALSQGTAQAQDRAGVSAKTICGSQFGTFVDRPGWHFGDQYIQGDNGLTYHRQSGPIGFGSFAGLSNGDRVRFDYAGNTYGGAEAINVCRAWQSGFPVRPPILLPRPPILLPHFPQRPPIFGHPGFPQRPPIFGHPGFPPRPPILLPHFPPRPPILNHPQYPGLPHIPGRPYVPGAGIPIHHFGH
jgi:hypothetical protein